MIDWIAITEGLPEHRKTVLVWDTYAGGECVLGCYIYGPKDDCWYLDSATPSEAVAASVTHWAEIVPPGQAATS